MNDIDSKLVIAIADHSGIHINAVSSVMLELKRRGLLLDEPAKVAEKSRRQASVRGTRLPPEFVVPAEWLNWAASNHMPGHAIALEAQKFVDYWSAKSGASATKLDWFATWRNWCRSSNHFGKVGGAYSANAAQTLANSENLKRRLFGNQATHHAP